MLFLNVGVLEALTRSVSESVQFGGSVRPGKGAINECTIVESCSDVPDEQIQVLSSSGVDFGPGIL